MGALQAFRVRMVGYVRFLPLHIYFISAPDNSGGFLVLLSIFWGLDHTKWAAQYGSVIGEYKTFSLFRCVLRFVNFLQQAEERVIVIES